MKILFLSRWFPYPANNGSKLRVYNLLRGLSQHHDVTLLSFTDQPQASQEASEIRSLCRDVQVVPWREFNPRGWRSLLGFLSVKPRSIVDTFSPEMARKITQQLTGEVYDLVVASQLTMAAYFTYFKDVPAVFEEVELGLSDDTAFESVDIKKRIRLTLTWFKLRSYLSRLLSRFRACVVASEQERQLIVENFPAYKNQIEVISNCVNIGDYQGLNLASKPNSLIFSGSFRYLANYEAMQWFVRDAYPLILRKIPEACLTITGDHANLPLPSDQNISLAGYVDDIKSLIASSSVSIAPLRSGGGTRLKILEAMAIGTAVVSTSKGAEGLDVQNGKHLLVADDPEKFADCVVKVLQDDDIRQQLAGNAGKLVREKYDWLVVMPRFLKLLETVAA